MKLVLQIRTQEMLALCDDISVSGRDGTRGYGNPKGSSFICLEKSQKASWRRRHLSGVLNDKKLVKEDDTVRFYGVEGVQGVKLRRGEKNHSFRN